MRSYFAGLYAFLLLAISFARSEVIENGGYSVLVTFSQNLPSQNGLDIIKNMKVSLQDASQILHNAIGFKFSKVTFEIPDFWDTSEWNITAQDTYHFVSSKADFVIDNTNDTVFGKFPYTEQYGSCGIPGHQITVPTSFFDDKNTFPKGVSLAREWLKYRYGVFDENGYFEDPLYPLYYHVPGGDPNDVQITHCTNFELAYNITGKDGSVCPSDKMLIDKLNSGDCVIDIDETTLGETASSIMYFQNNIGSMTQICGKDDDHTHNSRSRNKQNVLCSGRSVWDIVSKSNDTKRAKKEYNDIEYVYLKQKKPKVVVAWENTERMRSKSEIILNAIRKLMIDLPDGSQFSAIPYNAMVTNKEYTLKILDDVNKKTIATTIRSDFVIKDGGNINDAIRKAITVLKVSTENADDPMGYIMVLTGTAPDDMTVKLLENLNVCIKIIILEIGDSDISEKASKFVSNLKCAELEQLSLSETPEDTYQKLIESMEVIYPSKIQDSVTELVKVENLTKEMPLVVKVDDFTETVKFWIQTDRESDNFVLKLNGQEKTGIEFETFGNILATSYSPTQSGDISLSYPHDFQPMLVEVRKISKKGKYFNGEVIIHNTTDVEDSDQMPVIIYAVIRFGPYPVQNADVTAVIQGPDGGRSQLTLYDNGRGDPDITKNDGIYSRYFTNFTVEGEYLVTVTASNIESATKYGAYKDAGEGTYTSCCGSLLDEGGEIRVPFSKVFETTFTAKSGRPDEGYKPSRITDLRIDKVTEDEIILKWTAPGEEADSGTVQSYEVKSFTSPEEAKDNFDSADVLSSYTTSSAEKGDTEELKISFSDFDGSGLRYIAMKAKNSNSKTSDLSTILEVNIPDRETTDAPDNGGDGEDDKTNLSKTNPKTIGLIVGLIVGLILLLILIYVVIYFVIVKPRRKKQKKDKDNPIYESSPKTESNVMNPINFISADTLMKNHNEKVKAKSENKEPPIFKEEDFEDRNIRTVNEPDTSSNDRQKKSTYENPRNGQPFPPKSPKRTTPV